MKIALAQINTTVGDFDGNARKILTAADNALGKKADLVVFPELTLTGYPPRDLVEIDAFVRRSLESLKTLTDKASPTLGLVVGFVDRNPKGGGKPAFNAAALIADRKVQSIYHKRLVPTYDVFDEGRYFEPGRPTPLAVFKGKKIGISICEDIWNDKLFWEKRLYPTDPIEEQVAAGADLLINLSASPYAMRKEKRRHDMLQAVALKHGVPLAYVNLVGGNDELVFDGGSFILDDHGRVIEVGRFFEEDLVVGDPFSKGEGPKEIPYEENDLAGVAAALVTGAKDYAAKCGFKRAILGLSGGIDSALTAAIAAEALRPENVTAVIMPSPYTSSQSLEDARAVARNVGMPIKEIPIDEIFAVYRRVLAVEKIAEGDLALENVQARIRGNFLMALSNKDGSLVLSTGNKSELAVGYCTLYGDMSGGLAVISDLPKTLVYEIARFFNRSEKVIPERIFTKAPTAELRPNQTDQDSLPPYNLLDKILKAYIEEQKGREEILAMGFDPRTVADVIERVEKNEYKRRQAAPGIRVTEKAFGIGRRYPIARKI